MLRHKRGTERARARARERASEREEDGEGGREGRRDRGCAMKGMGDTKLGKIQEGDAELKKGIGL